MLGFTDGEPAINVYSEGGGFKAHQDKQSLTILVRFTAWLSGTPAEFYDAKFVARGEHRDVTRVRATGLVKVQLNVLTKGMRDFGYSVGEGAGMSTGETLNLSDAMLAGGGAASGVSFGSRS